MGLLDSLREDIASNKSSGNTDTNEVSKNLHSAMKIASKKILNQIVDGSVSLDIRDLKDLATVIQTVDAQGTSNTNGGAPQAPGTVVNIINSNPDLDAHENLATGETEIDQDNIINLSDKAVEKLISEQQQAQNENNYNNNVKMG
jgi:hypothetical protein